MYQTNEYILSKTFSSVCRLLLSAIEIQLCLSCSVCYMPLVRFYQPAYSPVNGHSGYFQYLTIINEAAINIHVDLCHHLPSYFSSQYIDEQLTIWWTYASLLKKLASILQFHQWYLEGSYYSISYKYRCC